MAKDLWHASETDREMYRLPGGIWARLETDREIYRLPEGILARFEQPVRPDTSHVLFPLLCQCDEDIDMFDSVLPEHPHRKLRGRFALAMRTTSSRFTIYLRSSAPTVNLALK